MLIGRYNEIIAATDDVQSIAANTGIADDVIDRVKRHVFMTEHHIATGPGQVERGYFEPLESIADSWTKAAAGELSPEELAEFKRFIAHEFVESSLIERGLPFRSADPQAWRSLGGDVMNIGQPGAFGAHDAAPLGDPSRPAFAHWERIIGESADDLQLADDLSNINDLVEKIAARVLPQ